MSIRLNHDTGLIQVTESNKPLSISALGVRLPDLPTDTNIADDNPGTIFFNAAVGCPAYIASNNTIQNLNMADIQLRSSLMSGAQNGHALYYESGSTLWKELSPDTLFPATGVVEMRPNMHFTNTVIIDAKTDNNNDTTKAEDWYDNTGDDEWEQLQLKIRHPESGVAGIAFQVGDQTGAAIIHESAGNIKIDATTTYLGGELIAHNGTVSQGSDIRLKKDIKSVDKTLDKVCKLETVTYKYKNGSDATHYGYIAQDVEKLFPELVSTSEDGTKAVAYAEAVSLMSQAIKELREEVQELRKPWWKRLLGL